MQNSTKPYILVLVPTIIIGLIIGFVLRSALKPDVYTSISTNSKLSYEIGWLLGYAFRNWDITAESVEELGRIRFSEGFDKKFFANGYQDGKKSNNPQYLEGYKSKEEITEIAVQFQKVMESWAKAILTKGS